MADPSARPEVPANDHGVLQPPVLGAWVPEQSVSVVVPSYGRQAELDVVLAALAAQSYPAHLLEVVVVDDGSQPPLRLPDVRPGRTRLVTTAGAWGDGVWGIAAATTAGARAADGEVLLRLDSDMLVDREHVAAHLRWHAVCDYVVVIGAKRFVEVDAGPPEPGRVRDAVAGGRFDELFDEAASLPHEWVEQVADRSEDLRTAGVDAHRISVGATISLPAWLYAQTGGLDPALPLGSDSEFGYRLSQAGAVFVYERAARAWHLGIPGVMRDRTAALRYRLPFVTGTMARPRYRRPSPGRQYPVPYTSVLVPAAGAALEAVRATVDAVLDSEVADLEVVVDVTGPAEVEEVEEVAGVEGVEGVEELLGAAYASEPRVRVVHGVAPTAYPSPFRLRLVPGTWVGPTALVELAAAADSAEAGLLLVRGTPGLRLERTAAYARARLLATDGEPLDPLVDRLFGTVEVDGLDVSVPPPGEAPRDWAAYRERMRAEAAAADEELRRRRRRSVRYQLGRVRRRLVRAG